MRKQKKCALITGGSGFLGTNLALRLINEQRKIRILDIKKPKMDGIEFIYGDVTNYGSVLKAAKGADVIFHLASPVPQTKADEKLIERAIVGGTENVLKACQKYGSKLVYISSSGVYGSNRNSILKETDEKMPYEGYGKGKWEAEKLCQEYARKGVKVVILRPVGIIGPYISGLVLIFLKLIFYNVPLITIGNGKNKIQLLSTSDCIDAILKAESYPKSGEVFNLGSKNVPTLRDQFKTVVKKVKSKSVVIPVPKYIAKLFFAFLHKVNLTILPPDHYRSLDKNIMVDITKAEKLLKWEPKKDNVQMTIEAYNWYAKNMANKNSSKLPKLLNSGKC